jgi:glycosyltransferase involved in cell wall biosynthesis
MRGAAAIVCLSASSRRELLGMIEMPEERVHVIPMGIDEAFRPAPDRQQVRRRLGISGDAVLMVGHTQPYMNIERMLRAFGMLVAQQTHDPTLIKIGLPFTPDQQRLIAELEFGDRVQVVGRVPTDELPAYYQAADVLLYAPLWAGFGLPPLEAMACGTPVVCSKSGALPEIVGDAALMADANDDAGLARALTEIVSSPALRRRLVDAGFERAGRFEWTHDARQLLELYRAIGQA